MVQSQFADAGVLLGGNGTAPGRRSSKREGGNSALNQRAPAQKGPMRQYDDVPSPMGSFLPIM